MGTNEYSQPASKSSWDSQDFGDVNMVVKMAHFHKSSRPQWVNVTDNKFGGNLSNFIPSVIHDHLSNKKSAILTAARSSINSFKIVSDTLEHSEH